MRNSRGVIYLLTGVPHAVRLVVSLWNLRKHYDGEITVYTTQTESHEVGRLCAADGRLNVQHAMTSELDIPKNRQFITKVWLMPIAPYDVTLYLDCDTMPVAPVDVLLDLADEHEFCATQFSNWNSSGKIVRDRLKRWKGIKGKDRPKDGDWPTDVKWTQPQIDKMVDNAIGDRPSPNGGVFAARRDAAILEPWFELSMVGRQTFIADEVALHLVLPYYKHAVASGEYNCSPTHGKTIVEEGRAKILHAHGEKHMKRDACRAFWLPAIQEILAENVADIKAWFPGKDTRLKEYFPEEIGCNE